MRPQNRMDGVIGNYIMCCRDKDGLAAIPAEDERLEVITYLSELPVGLLGWYPYEADGHILQIGSWFGAFAEMLCSRCKSMTIVERDPYRACMTEKRMWGTKDLDVVNKDICDYCKDCERKFDYVIYVVDENVDILPDVDSYVKILGAAKRVLSDRGKLLFAVPNRLGVKYLCGTPDPDTKVRFDGMTENNSRLYRFDRKGLSDLLSGLGFPYVKLYYPMPDFSHTQMVYTDAFRAGGDILERLHVYSTYKTERLLDEWVLTGYLAQNDVMHCFSNVLLAEAGDTPCSGVVYSALSAERDRHRSFATDIYDNDRVEKIALYPEGKEGIDRLFGHTLELAARGIPVLKMEKKEDRVVMERVRHPSLSHYLKEAVGVDPDLFLACMDKLREYILLSSEHVDAEKNCMRRSAPEKDWGVILQKAYLEMIPVNCFYVDGGLLFYDQEFVRENCPAGYVFFRALRDIYDFSPEIGRKVPLDTMKERYGLSSLWELYAQEEERFQTGLRRRNLYSGFFQWVKHLFGTVQGNRKRLDASEEDKGRDRFDPFSDLDGRRIILFGTGRMADSYLDRHGRGHPPAFMVDNDPGKWGSRKREVEIRDPGTLARLMPGTYRVVITVKDYRPIVRQLEGIGVGEDCYRIYDRRMDGLLGCKLSCPVSEGKYNIGYLPGVFDLFDRGHLNLLEKCKSRCHYLIVGVSDGDPMEREKQKGIDVPLEERMEWIKQCRYVDRVVAMEDRYGDPVEAWRELRFGCLFRQGDPETDEDHIWLRRRLRTLGAELEFING